MANAPAERHWTAWVAEAARRIRGRVSNWSLRARLVAVTLALTTVGLAVAGVATYGALQSFLVDRVDAQIRDSWDPAIRAMSGREIRRGPSRGAELPQGLRAATYRPDGVPFYELAVGTDADLFRSGATGYVNRDLNGEPYRVLYSKASPNGFGDLRPDPTGSFQVVLAVPLAEVDSTLGRLVLIELLVGLAALAAIGGGGYWLVRLGLRPLTDIEHTAAAIAKGDLSQRIEVEAPGTEVGSLSASLNTMLGTIEASFAEREESERRLRQFVADASHELQTPLTSVRGYAELFRRGAADNPEDLANAMGRIEAESKRMGLLVDDLLMLARLDQGRPIAREPVDLVELARELVGDARVVDPEREITFVAPEPVRITGDEARLRQVVANLLSNARTHTPPGTPVRVEIRRIAERAEIVVADQGRGLAPSHKAKVFERFFRADPSRARASGGSGLGLSIVAAIARAHGGEASVDSRPGEGATFRVSLPLDGGRQETVGGPDTIEG